MITKFELNRYLKNKKVHQMVYKLLLHYLESEAAVQVFISKLKLHLQKNATEFLIEKPISKNKEKERVLEKTQELLSFVKEHKKDCNSILDIGVGNGNVLTSLGHKLKINKNNLYGIDEVSYLSSNDFTSIEYDENTRIPLKDASVDVSLIMMVLHHTESPSKILQEAHRVLSDDGILIIRETNAYNQDLLQFNILMEYIFYVGFFNLPVKLTNHYFKKTKWISMFDDAGFDVSILKETPVENNYFTPVYYLLKKKAHQLFNVNNLTIRRI